MKLCMGCMERIDDAAVFCPHCGFKDGGKAENPRFLSPSAVLCERYIVGKALGCGGFGVTYLAWDGILQMKVAIKEYLPSGLSTRTSGQTEVSVFTGDKKEYFDKGKQQFIEEARRLAKFESVSGVVRVYDTFEENSTAYIVMDYLDGETLASRLKRDGKIPEQEAVRLIMPVLTSLVQIHKAGIIHRDISPDNIFITKDKGVKLIDFGSARYASAYDKQSLTVAVKQGYSPEEQYSEHSAQGAFTDVYSAAGVLYKMITGVTPENSLQRRAAVEKTGKDPLTAPGRIVNGLSPHIETAILNALNIRVEGRTKDMDTFISELSGKNAASRREETVKKKKGTGWPLWAKIAVPAAALLVIAAAAVYFTGWFGKEDTLSTSAELSANETRVPYVVNQDEASGEKLLSDANLRMIINGKRESDKIPVDHIMSQNTATGTVVPVNAKVGVEISAPEPKQIVPHFEGLSREDARKLAESIGLSVHFESKLSPTGLKKDCVAIQTMEAFSEIQLGEDITLLLSNDKSDGDIEKTPDFSEMTLEEAADVARDHEIVVYVTEYTYSETVTQGEIISQSPAENDPLDDGEVALVVSLGNEPVNVPDVLYRPENSAVQLIKGRGLKPSVTYEYSDTVAAGLVISQEPESSKSVDPESTVTLAVSEGSAPVEMPEVVGLDESEAVKALSDIGLPVHSKYTQDKNAKEGEVLNQEPKAGKDAFPGKAVTITIATKEEVAEVPDVVGTAPADAKSMIEKAGLKANIIEPDEKGGDVVISQYPTAHFTVKKSSTVEVNLYAIPNCEETGKIVGYGICGDASNTSRIEFYDSNDDSNDNNTAPPDSAADNRVSAVLYDNGNLYVFGNGAMINSSASFDTAVKDYETNSPQKMTGYAVSTTQKFSEQIKRNDIKKVYISEGIVSVGGFEHCSNLTEVKFADSVERIGNDAFRDCSKIKKVDMPDKVLSIGNAAFSECTALESVKLPGNLKYLGANAFSGCSYLKSIDLPNNIRYIGSYAFSSTNLQSINLPDNLQFLGGSAFWHCYEMKSITFPSGVFSIQKATCEHCPLEEVVISDGVATIGSGAFKGCTSLKRIVIPSSVTKINNSAFAGCSNLEEIVFEGSLPQLLTKSEGEEKGDNPAFGAYDSESGSYVTATAYVPKDDASWDDMSEDLYFDGKWQGGDITFRKYDPSEGIDSAEDSSPEKTPPEDSSPDSGKNIPDDAFQYNGHSYYLYKNSAKTWEQAKEYCESVGGYLAIINDSAENEALFEYMTDSGYESAYFGYSDAEEEGTWKWVGNYNGSYTNWAPEEPNNENKTEDYAMFYFKYTDGTWNDGDFNGRTDRDTSVYICEWDSADSSKPKPDSSDWKSLYRAKLEELAPDTAGTGLDYSTAGLVYVDDDDVPELIVCEIGIAARTPSTLYTIYNGEVVSVGNAGYYGAFVYKERGNVIEGYSQSFGDNYGFRRIVDGETEYIHTFHSDGKVYQMDNEDVSKSVYDEELAKLEKDMTSVDMTKFTKLAKDSIDSILG